MTPGLQSLAALEAWKALYKETREKVAASVEAIPWTFDESDIFAQTNAFIHRCRSPMSINSD